MRDEGNKEERELGLGHKWGERERVNVGERRGRGRGLLKNALKI